MLSQELTFSAYQIYNEKVFDMLLKGKPLRLKWDRSHEFEVENLTQRTCRRVADMAK